MIVEPSHHTILYWQACKVSRYQQDPRKPPLQQQVKTSEEKSLSTEWKSCLQYLPHLQVL